VAINDIDMTAAEQEKLEYLAETVTKPLCKAIEEFGSRSDAMGDITDALSNLGLSVRSVADNSELSNSIFGGLTDIASAIRQHAQAVRELAAAVERSK